MKIFVTSSYKFIYGGEFRKWVETRIIDPLTFQHEVIISEDANADKEFMMKHKCDLIINTGYNIEFLRWISANKDLKVISIIYNLNEEKILEDKEQTELKGLVANKSQLTFLSSAIITPSLITKKEIDYIYSPYKHIINVEKIYNLDQIFNIDTNINKFRKDIPERYIAMPFFKNGYDLNIILPHLFTVANDLDVKVVIPTYGEIHRSFIAQIHERGLEEKIFIITDLNDEDRRNIYHYSLATFFISQLNNSYHDIILSLESRAITLLNKNNLFYYTVCGDDIGYYNTDQRLTDSINDIRQISKETKSEIMGMQDNLIKRLNSEKTKTGITNILYQVYK